MAFQTTAAAGPSTGAPMAPGSMGLGAPPAPPRRRGRGCLGCLIAGPTSLGICLPMIFLFSPKSCATTSGAHQAALDAVRDCPAAVALVGEDVEPAWVGSNTGESGESGSSGHASWTFTVEGSGGRGELSFQANKDATGWHVASGTLTSGGRTVRIPYDCGAPAAPTGEAAMGAPTSAPGAGPPECAQLQRCCDALPSNARPEDACGNIGFWRGNGSGSMCGLLLRNLVRQNPSAPAACQ